MIFMGVSLSHPFEVNHFECITGVMCDGSLMISDIVDGRNLANQLRLVVYPCLSIFYSFVATSQGLCSSGIEKYPARMSEGRLKG